MKIKRVGTIGREDGTVSSFRLVFRMIAHAAYVFSHACFTLLDASVDKSIPAYAMPRSDQHRSDEESQIRRIS